mgnify:CR=1 FL=1
MRKILSKKIILRIVCFVLGVMFLVLPVFLFINNKEKTGQAEAKSEVFLELWNVDTFEGGKSSRGAFLEKQAIAFQKMNTGVYIITKSLNKEQLKIQLASGACPDFISFGIGVGDMISGLVKAMDSFDIRNELKFHNLVPWCYGGYVLCSKIQIKNVNEVLNGNSVGFGNENTVTINALRANLKTDISKINVYEKSLSTYSQYSAYEDFLADKFDVLIGTQRDFYRLKNRMDLGALSNCSFKFLEGYTDLVEWFACFSEEEEKVELVYKFVKYVLSDDVQKKLEGLGMFSVTGLEIYKDEYYKKFEEALQKPLKVLNPLLSLVEIKEMQKI